jgi:histidyl-tRNA synthetase
MSDTPQTLKGFRDFLPAEKRKRDFVAHNMRTDAVAVMADAGS